MQSIAIFIREPLFIKRAVAHFITYACYLQSCFQTGTGNNFPLESVIAVTDQRTYVRTSRDDENPFVDLWLIQTTRLTIRYVSNWLQGLGGWLV